ncbi:MAG: lytic transglycosylase domain-containing protein [Bacteroidia bacterium]|jgi:hypothetical protein|nr:lytic transglycosylase domain-containing protein [Bacteroidia bacterium]
MKIVYLKGFAVGLLTALLSLLFLFAVQTDESKQQQEFETYYKVYSVSMPDRLVFAGEPLPILDFDIQERLDRELLTNIYWQSQTILLIKRTARYFPVIEPILAKNGIPDDFKYLALAESGLQHVVSPAGATGFWQLLDNTARNYGLEINNEVDERYHLEKSTQAACDYFKEAYQVFKNWSLVAASYNMGIEGVRKQVAHQRVNSYYDLFLNTETSRYVFRILALKEICSTPKKYGFNIISNHLYKPIQRTTMKLSTSYVDLINLCNEIGITYKNLKLYNPWLRQRSLNIPSGKSYILDLPIEVKQNPSLQFVNDTLYR